MKHPRHPHPMRLECEEEKPFECNGCKELGFGPRYQCAKDCHFVLHELCFKARPTDRPRTHQFTVDFRFKFLWIPPGGPNRRLCHACERDVRGFMYRVQSNRRLYLHPCCMNLASTMSDPDGRMVLNLKDKVPSNSECVKCEKKDLKVPTTKGSLRGRSYVSSCEKYCYHVYCVKKLIVDNWKNGDFNDTSSSSSSPAPRGRSLVRGETERSSRSRSVQSDRGSKPSSGTSFSVLAKRSSSMPPMPRISSATRERLIKMVKVGFCLIVSKLFANQNPAPLFIALTDKVLNI